MDSNKKEFTLHEYNEDLLQVELSNISLIDCSVKVKKENFPSNHEIKLDIKEKIQIDKDHINKTNVIICHEYQTICFKKNKRDFAFKIICQFEVNFKQNKPLSKEFWDIYINSSLHLNTWPYFREFVQNMTQRIDVPPLTLPLFKAP